jgi:phosphatidate cytidylyltransferase
LKNQIAIQLLWTLGLIFGTAGLLLGINWALRGRSQAHTRMGFRFGVEVLFLAGVFVPAYLGGLWLLLTALVLAGLCAYELYGTFAIGGDSPYKVSGVAIGLALMLLCYARPGAVGVLFPPLLVAYWLLRGLAIMRPGVRVGGARRTLFGLLYPFLCLAFYVEIGRLPGGFGYVILYYGLAEVNDSAAYLIGSSFGRRKIFPRLSPNKTLEGVVGGIATTVVLAFVLRFAVPGFSTPRLVSAALLIALAGLAGDLFASRLKRRVGVKDYSSVIPTQGGVLDVYDAFIFVAPVFYYYLQLTGA